MPSPRSYVWPLAAALLSAALLIVGVDRGATREAVASLLSTTQTVVGQPIVYPTEAPAKVVAAVVTMQPGEETGWHQHDVPMFGYILDGEVTVDYGAKGTHVYRRGDAIVEAVDVPHNGRNTGAGEARILSVFMGAEGVPNTQMLPGHPAAATGAPQ